MRHVESAEKSPLYSEPERAAIAFAEAMTITGRKVTDEIFARARQHFSEAQLVELAAAVALENFRSKFNTAFLVESQGFCILR